MAEAEQMTEQRLSSSSASTQLLSVVSSSGDGNSMSLKYGLIGTVNCYVKDVSRALILMRTVSS